ncbi:MAG: Gfo/Idh/MocA family protein [Phycisphaerales bacterium]|jgi:predicted dehydrogenase
MEPSQPQRPDRRAFLGGALIAGAAIATPVVRAVGAVGAVAGSEQIKVVVVGCGGRGTGAAMQALKADPGVVIWAMADAFGDRIDAAVSELQKSSLADRVQVPPDRRFTGFDAATRACASGVHVAILAGPPGLRPDHLRAAVDAGLHVFCEKPMFVDAAGARRVIESARAARARNLNLVSGFCWRRSAPEREIFRRIADGQIGDVVAMHSDYLTTPLGVQARRPEWTDMEFQLRNWQHMVWLSGDFIVEQAVHSIDKINWAFGNEPPARCTAVGGRALREPIPERGDVYDHFAVVYEWPGDRRATLMWRQYPDSFNENVDTIIGTRGRAFVNGWAPEHRITGNANWTRSPSAPRPNMYQVEHDELFRAIRKGERIDDSDWMVQSCRLALMARMAAYTGQAVTWKDVLESREDLMPATLAMDAPPPVPTIRQPGRTKLV